MLAITNTTAVVEPFARINRKFDILYEKKAFLQQYTSECMEEDDLVAAREDLAELEADYEEAQTEYQEEEEEGME